MNSLVVLFSVVALAAAKPSGLQLGSLAYSSPIIAAAPSAVSSQSRVDIKSSPAVVTTSIEPAARTIIAEPTLLSAPVAIAAPSAVSSQSRIDIKSTPAVTTSVISAAPAIAAYSAPAIATAAYAAPAISAYAAPAISTYAAPAFSSYAAPAFSAYAAPAISAYASPAISTYAANAISAYAAPAFATSAVAPTLIKTASLTSALPLETPEVIAARAAHLEAKVLSGAHLIRKRSVAATPLLSTHFASPVVSTYAAATPLLSSYAAGPLTYSALSTPLVAKTYGVHAW